LEIPEAKEKLDSRRAPPTGLQDKWNLKMPKQEVREEVGGKER
jgi:hypothetical protein